MYIRVPQSNINKADIERIVFLLNGLHTGFYYDRGDPSGWDFQVGDLTTDETWNEIDLSSIVPAGTKRVEVFCRIKTAAVGNYIAFQKKGNTNYVNVLSAYTLVANQFFDLHGHVSCDEDRIIEYYASSVSWTTINFLIRGYEK